MRTIKPKCSNPVCLEVAERLEKLEGMIADLRLEKITAELFNQAKTAFLLDIQQDMGMALTNVFELSEIFSRITDASQAQEFSKDLMDSCQELLYFLQDVLESIQAASGVCSERRILYRMQAVREAQVIVCQSEF